MRLRGSIPKMHSRRYIGVVSAVAFVAMAPPAFAQSASFPAQGANIPTPGTSFPTPNASAAPPGAGAVSPDASRALALGGWLFSPSLFVGGVYNTNVNQTETGRVASWGERVTPSFTALLNNGIYQTSVYGLADLQNYSAGDHRTTVDATVGFDQRYEARRDLTFDFNGAFTRQADVFGGTAFVPPKSGESTVSNVTPGLAPQTTVAPQVSPVRYNQFSGSASATKQLGQGFASLGGNITSTVFDSDPTTVTSRNGTVYTLAARGGYNITPQLYAFIDPQLSTQRYTDTTRNSNGYRVTGGVGTSQLGIWQGEIYGGYQAQKNDTIGTYDGDVIGLRVLYSPTPMWILQGSLDEQLGGAAISGTTGVAGKITTALLNVGYRGMPDGWTANGRFGFIRTAVVDSVRVDNGWLAGANVGYNFWRNWALTLDYQYKSVNSNFAGDSFDQQVVSLGVTYTY